MSLLSCREKWDSHKAQDGKRDEVHKVDIFDISEDAIHETEPKFRRKNLWEECTEDVPSERAWRCLQGEEMLVEARVMMLQEAVIGIGDMNWRTWICCLPRVAIPHEQSHDGL
jgi:hypothetical protein